MCNTNKYDPYILFRTCDHINPTEVRSPPKMSADKKRKIEQADPRVGLSLQGNNIVLTTSEDCDEYDGTVTKLYYRTRFNLDNICAFIVCRDGNTYAVSHDRICYVGIEDLGFETLCNFIQNSNTTMAQWQMLHNTCLYNLDKTIMATYSINDNGTEGCDRVELDITSRVRDELDSMGTYLY